VKGAFHNAGIFQIVIGPGDVDRVYAELITLAGMKPAVTIAGNIGINTSENIFTNF
jgi:phosphotransferase system IIB component